MADYVKVCGVDTGYVVFGRGYYTSENTFLYTNDFEEFVEIFDKDNIDVMELIEEIKKTKEIYNKKLYEELIKEINEFIELR